MADLAGPLGELGTTPRAYVLPDQKVLFISVAKNACTSIKWLLARVAGEDLDSFRPGLRNPINTAEAIHDRALWRHVPLLGQLSPAERGEIRPDNGWFVFGVTRDPRSRMFSAWQNKFLLRGPLHRRYRYEPWLPSRSFSADGIRRDFGAFVEAMQAAPGHPVMKDSHFRAQTKLLRLDSVGYSRLYDIRELAALLTDLDVHLRGHGYAGPALELGRYNDTPLRVTSELLTPDLRARVESIYAADFEAFGDRWSFAAIEGTPPWPPEVLATMPLIADMGQRIGELRGIARHKDSANTQLRGRLRKQRAKSRVQQARLRRRVARLTADLAAAREREGRRPTTRVRRALRVIAGR